jgi:hypothetical protein
MQKLLSAKLVMLSIGFVFVVSLVVPTAIAQSTQINQATNVQDPAQTVTINGKVSAVSASTVTVVDAQKAEHLVVLDAKTMITKAGKAITPAEIKAEDLVAVVASKGEGDSLVAKTITIS